MPDLQREQEQGAGQQRDLRMQPGMIIDSLMVGEDIETIDSNRPNPDRWLASGAASSVMRRHRLDLRTLADKLAADAKRVQTAAQPGCLDHQTRAQTILATLATVPGDACASANLDG